VAAVEVVVDVTPHRLCSRPAMAQAVAGLRVVLRGLLQAPHRPTTQVGRGQAVVAVAQMAATALLEATRALKVVAVVVVVVLTRLALVARGQPDISWLSGSKEMT
jgi:hypothetical protein